MKAKPTYEELEQRIKKLEKESIERKRAERKLKESEEKYRLLFNKGGDAILVAPLSPDKEHEYIDVNEIACKRYGYTKEEFLKMTPKDLAINDLKGKILEIKEKLFDGNKIVTEMIHVAKDGTRIPVELSIANVEIEGRPVGFAFARDITERKRTGDEKERLINDLQKALSEVKTLQGFLPICSHCKKIRDDKGYWNQIEAYIHAHSDAEFSHSICPECAKNHYPDFDLSE